MRLFMNQCTHCAAKTESVSVSVDTIHASRGSLTVQDVLEHLSLWHKDDRSHGHQGSWTCYICSQEDRVLTLSKSGETFGGEESCVIEEEPILFGKNPKQFTFFILLFSQTAIPLQDNQSTVFNTRRASIRVF